MNRETVDDRINEALLALLYLGICERDLMRAGGRAKVV